MALNNTIKILRGGGEHVSDHLSAYLDDELNAATRGVVESHLQKCEGCTADLETLRSARALLRSMEPVPLPRSFILTPEMVGRVETERKMAPVFSFLPRLRLATAALAVILAVVLSADVLKLPSLGTDESNNTTFMTAQGKAPSSASEPVVAAMPTSTTAAAAAMAAPTSTTAMAAATNTTTSAAPTSTTASAAPLARTADPTVASVGGVAQDTANTPLPPAAEATATEDPKSAMMDATQANMSLTPSTTSAGGPAAEADTQPSAEGMQYNALQATPLADITNAMQPEAAPPQQPVLSWLWLEIPLAILVLALAATVIAMSLRQRRNLGSTRNID